MKFLETLMWVSFAIVFYSFIGYGIILWLLIKIKNLKLPATAPASRYQPDVTLVIPCYNEADVIQQKIINSFDLDYPKDKLTILFITDGSTDNSAEILQAYPTIQTLHSSIRAGKTAAENRAMQHVKTPVVIFSDANTLLNKEAVKNIVRHFADAKVGCVAGEKRIMSKDAVIASAAGEGLYWKYESFLKKLDSQLYSAVGAAGELVAFRTSLYENLPENTILDDFIQSMYIAAKGYKIVYEPDAYAVETAAASIAEELKRKIRICAGGWQSIVMLHSRLSLVKLPVLYFQYFSHRVLRWTINPFLLILLFFINLRLSINGSQLYQCLLILQVAFYIASITGFILQDRKQKIKAFFVPYYFCMMNYAVVLGLLRFIRGNQSGIWEKNVRMPL